MKNWQALEMGLLALAVSLGLSTCGGTTPSAPETPVATPTPTPAPTPTPKPLTVIKACALPASSNPGAWEPDGCEKLTGKNAARLSAQVNAAIDRAFVERPELFNFNDVNGGNPRVLDREAYHVAVVAALSEANICGKIEKEEIAIKYTNDFNEQWNIWTSSGYVWRKYFTTCTPSWF